MNASVNSASKRLSWPSVLPGGADKRCPHEGASTGEVVQLMGEEK